MQLWDLWTREHIGLPVDVWSLGCLLYLLAYGRLPFDGDAKLQILNGTYALPPGRPAAIEHLIQAMLIVDPKARISASHAVQAAESLLSSSREERPQAAGPQPPSSRETAPAEPRRSTFQSNTNGAEGFAGWKAEFGSGGSNSMAGRDSAARAFEDGWAAFGDLPAQGSPPVASGASAPAAAAAPAVAPLERPHGAAVGSRPGSRTSQSTGEMRPRSGTSNSSSGAGAGGSSALPPSAGPLAAAMEGLSMQTPHPQLQEHCQVLEQLLEVSKWL